MNFYQTRNKSIKIVNFMTQRKDGTTFKEMVITLNKQGGLGKRFLREYLEDMNDTINEDDGVYKWKV